MHVYAISDPEREWRIVHLTIIAIVSAFLFGEFIKAIGWQPPWWVDTPAVFGFMGIYLTWFNKVLWNETCFGWKLSKIPNLNGTWVGTIESSHEGATTTKCILHVSQSWLNISIRLETEYSRSCSTTLAINTPDPSFTEVIYTYSNEPNAGSAPSMNAHRGTTHLVLMPSGKDLEGDYFSGRGRQNFGSLKFRWVSSDFLPRATVLQQHNP